MWNLDEMDCFLGEYKWPNLVWEGENQTVPINWRRNWNRIKNAKKKHTPQPSWHTKILKVNCTKLWRDILLSINKLLQNIEKDGKLEKYIENVLVLGFATDDGGSCKINGKDFAMIYLALKEDVYTNMVKASRVGYTFQMSITGYKGNDKSIINPKIKKDIDDIKIIIQNECQDLSICG